MGFLEKLTRIVQKDIETVLENYFLEENYLTLIGKDGQTDFSYLQGGDKVRGLDGGRGGYGAGLREAALLLPYRDCDVTNHPPTAIKHC